MGLFAEWQPEYAAHNVVTFPLGGNKKPAVTHYQNAGLNRSTQWAFKFGEADAFAFLAGQRNRITVLDYDSKDETGFRRELDRYGDSPIIVRSGSGNFQAWFRHNGERRKIRPRRDVPLDVLGAGPVIAPPSQGSRAPYQFLHGSLADLARLPVMRTGEDLQKAEDAVRGGAKIRQGGRREALVVFLRKQAGHCDTFDDLLDVAHGFADQCLDRADGHPFTDAEIVVQVRSVWEWTQQKIAAGEHFVGRGKTLVVSHADFDTLAKLGPDAYFLEQYLRRHHWGREFAVANDMRLSMPGGEWSVKRIQDARKALLTAERIKEVRAASKAAGAAAYVWV